MFSKISFVPLFPYKIQETLFHVGFKQQITLAGSYFPTEQSV